MSYFDPDLDLLERSCPTFKKDSLVPNRGKSRYHIKSTACFEYESDPNRNFLRLGSNLLSLDRAKRKERQIGIPEQTARLVPAQANQARYRSYIGRQMGGSRTPHLLYIFLQLEILMI